MTDARCGRVLECGCRVFSRNLDLLALEGRLLEIAVLQVEARSPRRLLRQRLTVTGSTLRSRTVMEKGAIAAELEREVWPMLAARKIVPIIHAVFPLKEAAAAHRLMESGSHIGKIVLTA